MEETDDNDDFDRIYDDDYYRPASHSIIPVVRASISILGSYIILREVYCDHRDRRRQQHHRSRHNNISGNATILCLPISRVLMSISVADIFFSIGLGMSTFVSPEENENLEWSFGNVQSCEVQGFFVQLGFVASSLFCGVLAMFYYLTISYRWSDDRLQCLECWVYPIMWIFSLAVSIFPITLGLYNSAWGICWIASAPEGCKDSFNYGDDANCTRGGNAWIYSAVFSIFPSWICLVIYLVVMILLYCVVRDIELRQLRYVGSLQSGTIGVPASRDSRLQRWSPQAGSNNSSLRLFRASTNRSLSRELSHDSLDIASSTGADIAVDRSKSRAVAMQALLYAFAFLLTHLPRTLAQLTWAFFQEWNTGFYVFAYAVVLPMQGFFNFVCCLFPHSRNENTRRKAVPIVALVHKIKG